MQTALFEDPVHTT